MNKLIHYECVGLTKSLPASESDNREEVFAHVHDERERYGKYFIVCQYIKILTFSSFYLFRSSKASSQLVIKYTKTFIKKDYFYQYYLTFHNDTYCRIELKSFSLNVIVVTMVVETLIELKIYIDISIQVCQHFLNSIDSLIIHINHYNIMNYYTFY